MNLCPIVAGENAEVKFVLLYVVKNVPEFITSSLYPSASYRGLITITLSLVLGLLDVDDQDFGVGAALEFFEI